MKKDDRVYLHHILEAIGQIREYTHSMDLSGFMQARLVQDGVIRQLEIIGEATKNISSAVRNMDEAIPWKDMAGMRDVLIHQYFGVDLAAVWDTVQQELPEVEKQIRKLLTNLDV